MARAEAFVEHFGAWRGAYEEGSLFFYMDEYVKDAPKDVPALLLYGTLAH